MPSGFVCKCLGWPFVIGSPEMVVNTRCVSL